MGKVNLTISAFSTAERKGASKSIKIMVNPEGLSKRHEHKYARYRGINSSKNSAVYAYSLAEEMSFKLTLIDISVQDYGLFTSSKTVAEQLKDFMDTCYKMNGNIHEPNFLNIKWGDIDFDCKLKTLDIKYNSFDSSGKPRRAELDVVFVEDLAKQKIAELEGKNSPDLTHVVAVKEGDTLPLLTEMIYGSSNASLYLEVARVNQLDDFRDLRQGQQIYFPPLEK